VTNSMGDADISQLEFLKRVQDRSLTVGVVGLGYVGLPLVRTFVASGFRTMGFDVDPSKVERLLAGDSYIGHIPSSWIADCVADGKFIPTPDMARLSEADALLICVPTPLTAENEPDLSFIRSTGQQIAKTLRAGQLVVLESTTYPGTTRDVLLPILESSGRTVGRDFFLAYSPEREDPGNREFETARIPKVVGGIDDTSLRLAQELYHSAVERVVPVSSCEAAEACKMLENTYRAVNIALVNELKVIFDRMKIDVWEVIDAAATKPFGFQPFYPGPGLGGHCLPIDPFYLSWIARRHGAESRFIELAGKINTGMPRYVADRLEAALLESGKTLAGSRICILGIAYKRDVDDPRESPSFELIDILRGRGAEISYNDPHIPRLPQMRRHDVPPLMSTPLTAEYLSHMDCVLIVTDHSSYDYDFIARHAPIIVDTRNATRAVVCKHARIYRA